MAFTENILFLSSLVSKVNMLCSAAFREEDERQNENLVLESQACGPRHPGVGCSFPDQQADGCCSVEMQLWPW